MTLTDLWPSFQGPGMFEIEYLINILYRQSYYSTLIGNHTEHNGTRFGDLEF